MTALYFGNAYWLISMICITYIKTNVKFAIRHNLKELPFLAKGE